jgi:hypothetical protein
MDGAWRWNVVEPGQIAILDLRSGRAECVLTCDSAPGAVNFVSNDELIVGEWNGHTSLWNLVTRHVVGSALAEKSLVNASSFSPDNPGMREVTFVATPRAGSPSIPFSIPSPRNTRAS